MLAGKRVTHSQGPNALFWEEKRGWDAQMGLQTHCLNASDLQWIDVQTDARDFQISWIEFQLVLKLRILVTGPCRALPSRGGGDKRDGWSMGELAGLMRPSIVSRWLRQLVAGTGCFWDEESRKCRLSPRKANWFDGRMLCFRLRKKGFSWWLTKTNTHFNYTLS